MQIIKNSFISCLIVLTIVSSTNVFSQSRNTLWLRYNGKVELNKNWSTDIDFLHRRQSHFDEQNPFKANLLFGFRIMAYYSKNKNWVWGFSPLTFFRSYLQSNQGNEILLSPINEYRIAANIEYSKMLKHGIKLQFRPGLEYRMYEKNENIVRLRNRLQLSYNFNDKMIIKIGDEYFNNINNYSNISPFDQNRIYLFTQYTISNKAIIEIGYIYTQRPKNKSYNKSFDNNIVLNFIQKFQMKSLKS